MTQPVSVVGIGMTPMDRRDLTPDAMACQAVNEALADAGLRASDVGLVIASNALGGRLCDQGCIRGQTWLRDVGPRHHRHGQRRQLLRRRLLRPAPRRHGRPGRAVPRARGRRREDVDRRPGRDHRRDRGRAARRRERHQLRAELRQRRRQPAHGPERHVGPATRSTTRHDRPSRSPPPPPRRAAAARAIPSPSSARRSPSRRCWPRPSVVGAPHPPHVLVVHRRRRRRRAHRRSRARGAPRIRASVLRSGNGDLDYHDRLHETAEEAWKAAGVGPRGHRRRRAARRHQRRGALRPRVAGLLPAGRGGRGHLGGRHRRRRSRGVREPERGPRLPGPPPRRPRASARWPSSSPSCGAAPAPGRSTGPAWAWPSTPGGSWPGATPPSSPSTCSRPP